MASYSSTGDIVVSCVTVQKIYSGVMHTGVYTDNSTSCASGPGSPVLETLYINTSTIIPYSTIFYVSQNATTFVFGNPFVGDGTHVRYFLFNGNGDGLGHSVQIDNTGKCINVTSC